MMLPIIFRRRHSGYRQGSYRPSRNTGAGKRHGGCLAFSALVSAIAVALWALWYFYPLSDEEKAYSATRLVTETRYIISSDTNDILAFTATRGDTILEGISNASASPKGPIVRDTVNALWVRKWEYLPYNGGNLAAEASDTASICRIPPENIAPLLDKQARNISEEQANVREQQADVEYFLRTHTVLDNGFDIVARYGKKLELDAKALAEAANVVKNAQKSKSLSLRLERRYYLFADSTGRRTECIPVKTKGGLIYLTVKEPCGEPGMTSRLPKRQDAPALLKGLRPRKTAPKTSAVDSIGTYKGGRDSLAMPHGYGRLLTFHGAYYEGEWVHGKRTGVGFSIIPGKRLCLGEWKDDRFLGERIAYTPERIYGIDISRHQHEKGKKRYSINWKDLRIISLGKKSKKIIHGKVDYPVRFVFIKATEGVTVRNRYFAADYAAARKHGYRTGAYHFFSTKTSGRQQAINFLRHSRYTKGDLPPVLDLEPTDAQIRKMGGIDNLFHHARQWLNTVEKAHGVRPILYISQRFVNKYLSLAPDLHNNYNVWIARYGEYKPDVNLSYWQLSPDGRVKGIHGDVDINVYNGFDFP